MSNGWISFLFLSCRSCKIEAYCFDAENFYTENLRILFIDVLITQFHGCAKKTEKKSWDFWGHKCDIWMKCFSFDDFSRIKSATWILLSVKRSERYARLENDGKENVWLDFDVNDGLCMGWERHFETFWAEQIGRYIYIYICSTYINTK